MDNMRKVNLITIAVFVVASIHSLYSASADQLLFNKPAQFFEEAFVLGNGKLGATVFGSPGAEKIYLIRRTMKRLINRRVNQNRNEHSKGYRL